jgi:drug/metabolite transporter (DMT)-like permease
MKLWPYIALTLAGCCWGLGLPFGKLALRETDPSHMIVLRFALAGIAVLPWALLRASCRRLLRNPAVILAGVCYAAGFLIQFEGLARCSVAVAALLVGLMPALIAACAAWTGEKVELSAWLGVLAATLGAALIAGGPGAGSTPMGVILSLLSLPVFLGWLYAVRHAPKETSEVDVSCAAIVIAAVLLALGVSLFHGPPSLRLSAVAWAGLVGQALFSTVLATIAWQLGAPRVASAAAGVFINLEPLVGALIGVAVFHDRPTLAAGFGGLMIIAGSLGAVMGEHKASDAAKPLSPSDAGAIM